AMLGDRIDKWSLPRRRRTVVTGNFWGRMAAAVMRRPVPVATVTILFLLFLGAPLLRINFGLPDDRVLPETAGVRQVADQIRDDYESNEAGALSVVVPGADMTSDAVVLDTFATELSSLEGVARVDGPTGIYAAGTLVSPQAPLSERFD